MIADMKPRRFFRDGIEEEIVGAVRVHVTSEGHTVESYMLVDGTKRFFVTLAGSHLCAHGGSLANAISDALWKDPIRRPSMQSLLEDIKKEGRSRKITLNEFRLLTGACLTGCQAALAQVGRDDSPMTAYDIQKVVSKEWGSKLLSILGWEEIKS